MPVEVVSATAVDHKRPCTGVKNHPCTREEDLREADRSRLVHPLRWVSLRSEDTQREAEKRGEELYSVCAVDLYDPREPN